MPLKYQMIYGWFQRKNHVYCIHFTKIIYNDGERNGTPLQYSCLERGASQATVHGVSKSWTRMKGLRTAHTPGDARMHLRLRQVLSAQLAHPKSPYMFNSFLRGRLCHAAHEIFPHQPWGAWSLHHQTTKEVHSIQLIGRETPCLETRGWKANHNETHYRNRTISHVKAQATAT